MLHKLSKMSLKKVVFWSVMHKHTNIALTEDLSRYARGETFWKAMLNLCEILRDWRASPSMEESDISSRVKMYSETGINKVEIFIAQEGNEYMVKCSNTRSYIPAKSENDALLRYVEVKAHTSNINTGNRSES